MGRLATRRPALSHYKRPFGAAAKGAEIMFDWNGNGREDWGGRYIDYQIYNDICNSDEEAPGENHHPSGNAVRRI